MKKTTHPLIAEVPRRQSRIGMTIGIDLGDVWSHYCTLNEDGEVVDRGRFRTSPKAVEKWFTDLPPARVAMEAGTHSIWISEQLQELGHEVIVANVRELRAISHSDRKSDQVDAEKLARYARLDPEILRPIAHRTVEQQEALTLIRARDLLAHSRGERCAWTDEVLGLSYARFFDTLFRRAKPGRYATGTRAGTRSGASADRGDDRQDQAVRSTDPTGRPDRVSGDTGTPEDPRCWPHYGADLCADLG
jgi:transposase